MDATIFLLILAIMMIALPVALIMHRPRSSDDLFELPPPDMIKAPEMTDPIFPLTKTQPDISEKPIKVSKPRAPRRPPLPSDAELGKMTKNQLLELATQRGLELDRKLTKALIIQTLKTQKPGRKKP